ANFHQFNGIHELPNHTVSLDLGGTVPSKFRSYFDLYLLEVSRDMTEWNPLASLLRTNASTDPLTYTDTDAGGLSHRFYRVSSNLLVTPFMQPTGPFAVGTFARKFTDPSNTNRYNLKTNSSFMVTFWYPAQRTAGQLPAPYTDPKLASYRTYWSMFTNVVPQF